MFDPKRYDTRMRDPEGRRRKPSAPEPRMPREARIRKRPEERAEAPVDEHVRHRGPEVAFGRRRPRESRREPARRRATRSPPGGGLALVVWLGIALWRFAAGASAQGWIVLALGGLGLLVARVARSHRAVGEDASRRSVGSRSLLFPRRVRKTGTAPGPTAERPAPPTRARPAPSPAAAPRPVHLAARKPPPAAPRRTRIRRPKESLGGAIALAVVVSAIGAVLKCSPDDAPSFPPPQADRRVVHRPPRQPRRPARPTRSPRRAEPPVDVPIANFPPIAADRISGRVRFGDQGPLVGVEVMRRPGHERAESVLTDRHGVFVFDGLRAGTHEVRVRGCVDLAAGRGIGPHVATGTRVELTVDPAHAFLLAHGDAPDPNLAPAEVQVARIGGPERAMGTWRLDGEVALVTGLDRRGRYDVLVRVPLLGTACLVERAAPGRRVPIRLDAGASIRGRLLLPEGVGGESAHVTLAHGSLHVEAEVARDGRFRAVLLPLDSWWDVDARLVHRGRRTSSAEPDVRAGAGEVVVLDLR